MISLRIIIFSFLAILSLNCTPSVFVSKSAVDFSGARNVLNPFSICAMLSCFSPNVNDLKSAISVSFKDSVSVDLYANISCA